MKSKEMIAIVSLPVKVLMLSRLLLFPLLILNLPNVLLGVCIVLLLGVIFGRQIITYQEKVLHRYLYARGKGIGVLAKSKYVKVVDAQDISTIWRWYPSTVAVYVTGAELADKALVKRLIIEYRTRRKLNMFLSTQTMKVAVHIVASQCILNGYAILTVGLVVLVSLAMITMVSNKVRERYDPRDTSAYLMT